MIIATQLAERLCKAVDDYADQVGLVVVDHGSRRPESNELLLQVVDLFRQQTGIAIVEPAHMELAEPSIADAFAKTVEAGARLVVIAPFFLAPGRHMQEDIPRLAAEAAAQHPGVCHTVAAPLGAHPAMLDVLSQRILESLR